MTGLDPVEDRIMEVAAIVTDWKFKEIATYEAAIKVGPRLVEKRMLKGPAASFWQTVPLVRDALIQQNYRDILFKMFVNKCQQLVFYGST